jgi:long-chain acyl-CoA synthetase
MKTLQDLFLNSKKWEHKPAFVYRTGIRRLVFTYGDFYQIALKTAGWLEKQGIDKGDRVIIWAPNSPWWAAVFWGAVLRGAIVVPIDFTSGKERAETIIDLTEGKVILQSEHKLEKTSRPGSFFIEDLQFLIEDCSHPSQVITVTESETAELIYTSGTTGNPKGVMLSHGNLIANVLQTRERIPIVTEKFNFLSLLPLSHMFEQVGNLFTPFLNGSTTIYIRSLKPSAIMSALAEEDIYVTIVVPRLLQALKNSIQRELAKKTILKYFKFLVKYGIHKKFGKHFKFFVSGGSALEADIARFWQNLGFTVLEGYGLTECSPILTSNLLSEQRIGSVGVPLSGVIIELRNKEILAKGKNVFSGYWNKPEATKESFTKDGWFKTGDLGEVSSDGWVSIKGRLKDMIVTAAGINVYPQDIEQFLNKTSGVKESCVVGKLGSEGEEVHAVLILEDGVSAKHIIETVNEKLDAQQQIISFSIWPKTDFPKTTTLKIQKFAVKLAINQPQLNESKFSDDKLITLISKVTGKDLININEKSTLVQDLGLTSVARLELVNYIEQEFRLDLEDTEIMQRTTVADVRKIIEKRERSKTKNYFHLWPNTRIGRAVRSVINVLINYPIFYFFVKVKKTGLENLDNLKMPVIFISNHISYFDHPAIVYSLPKEWQYRTAAAAWEEFFFKDKGLKGLWKRFAYYYGIAGLNLFPLPQSKGFRKSLEFMGKLIDRKINILVFPEGERSLTADMVPFMDGLGLMVKELRVPIIPIRIKGMEKIFPRNATGIKKGEIEVVFGPPIYFKQESTRQIIDISQKAIKDL